MKIVSTLLTLTGMLGLAGAAHAQDIKLDFRGGKTDADTLRYAGPEGKKYFTIEEEGLRLRFTGGNAPKQPVGVYWNTRIRGDFTATLRYEILQDDRPEKGSGAGVEMYLTLDTPVTEVKKRDGVAYARIMHPGQGP